MQDRDIILCCVVGEADDIGPLVKTFLIVHHGSYRKYQGGAKIVRDGVRTGADQFSAENGARVGAQASTAELEQLFKLLLHS